MIKSLQLLFCTLFLTVSLLSTAQAAVDPLEPDNSIETATILTVDSPQNHSLDPVSDQDWSKIELLEASHITLTTSGPESSDTVLTLYDENRNLILQNDDGGAGLYSKIEVNLVSGIYFVKTNEFSNNDLVDDYTLTFTSVPFTALDSFEPDNTLANATTIVSGTTQTHNMSGGSDEDWYTFEISTNSTVKLNISNPTFSLNQRMLLEFFEEDENTLIDSVEGTFLRKTFDTLTPGIYFVKVSLPTDTISIIQDYTIDFTVEQHIADQYEADNTLQTATDIRVGIPQQHSIVPNNDEDWVTFEITENSTVNLNVTNRDNSGSFDPLLLEIYKDDENTPIVSEQGFRPSLQIITLTAGTYYAKLASATAQSIIRSYTLALTVVPHDLDSFEPDNTLAEATPIAQNTPQTHSINPVTDQDWSKIELSEPSHIILATSGLIGNSTLLELFDENEQLITRDFSGGIGNYSRIDINLESGIYYARTTASSGNELISNYSLTLTVEALNLVSDQYESDDSLATATTIETGSPQVHNLSSSTDQDWVTFETTETVAVSLAISNRETTTDRLLLEIYKDNENTLIRSREAALPEYRNNILAPGIYFAKISSRAQNVIQPGNYTLSLSIEPYTADSFETDNTLATAIEIVANSSQQHNIVPNNDIDWSTFEITEISDVTIEITNRRTSNRMLLEVYKNAEENLIESQINFGFSRTELTLTPGIYYTKLSLSNAELIEPSYTINLIINPIILDSYEPDNSPGDAKEILPDSPQEHSIVPRNDQDWVTFTLSSKSNVIIETSGSSFSDTVLELFDSGNSDLAFDDDSGDALYSKIEIPSLEKGTYFIKSRSISGKIDSYQITLSTISTDSDNDGIPDTWETDHGLNPNNPDDALDDRNNDGLSNLDEFNGLLPPALKIIPIIQLLLEE